MIGGMREQTRLSRALHDMMPSLHSLWLQNNAQRRQREGEIGGLMAEGGGQRAGGSQAPFFSVLTGVHAVIGILR